MANKKLTVKQRKFVDEYIKTGNASQSAIKAGYSKKTSRSIAQRLLTNVNIKEAIEKKMKAKERKSIASQDEVLEYLTSVMRGEPQTVHNKSIKRTGDTEVESELKGTFTPNEENKLDAAKELLKRYVVTSNEEAKARVRKLQAEAEIAEAKAKALSQVMDKDVEQVSELLELLYKEV